MKFYDLLVEKAKEDGIVKNVVGGIVMDNKKNVLILTRKADDFMGGIDELPSGGVKEGESLYDALVREVKEETNLDVENVSFYVNSFDYLSSSGKKTRQYNFVVKVKTEDDIKLTEHDNYKWESIANARNNPKITDEIKYTLEEYFFNLIQETRNNIS